MKKDDDYYQMKVQGCLDNHLLEEAISVANEGIRLYPQHAPLFLLRGVAYEFKHDYKAAIRDLSQYLRFNPHAASTLHYRGICYWKLGQLDEAIKDFSQAIALDDNSSYLFDRARVYIEIKNFISAKEDLQRVIESDINPLSKLAKQLLAEILDSSQDP
ncbi:tetratricopeptide repeat protein [Phototrophicus methaneseepsis]|uniref:Tetratricopeptide repeat protein n=1 Tax=Phototrophicus methaneseepsis TaxID=2710758 RepID=A0A7S8E8R3_9CHLR|nr:tetratricopeptide repeat protein [Phototrophicus methaneseepsis]QPC82465.1 tetratricopeptide repeat protein [Phototrophicus methaneseepsis]